MAKSKIESRAAERDEGCRYRQDNVNLGQAKGKPGFGFWDSRYCTRPVGGGLQVVVISERGIWGFGDLGGFECLSNGLCYHVSGLVG